MDAKNVILPLTSPIQNAGFPSQMHFCRTCSEWESSPTAQNLAGEGRQLFPLQQRHWRSRWLSACAAQEADSPPGPEQWRSSELKVRHPGVQIVSSIVWTAAALCVDHMTVKQIYWQAGRAAPVPGQLLVAWTNDLKG